MQAGRIVRERLAGARHRIQVVEVVAVLGVKTPGHAQDPRMDLNRGVVTEEPSEPMRHVRQRPLRIVVAGDDMHVEAGASRDAQGLNEWRVGNTKQVDCR